MDARTAELGRKALEGDDLSREEGLHLAERAPLRDLIYWAGEVSEWGYGSAFIAGLLADYYLKDSLVTMQANSEVLITASVLKDNRFIYHKTLVYYINQADWHHYPTQDTAVSAKKFRVTGD